MSDFIAKLIKADSTIRPVYPNDGQRFTLGEIRKLIGCQWLQRIVPPSNIGAVLYINEDGKLGSSPSPTNIPATEMWQDGCDPESDRACDQIVGDVLLCHTSQEPV